jgi:hypothetical protein
VVRLEGVLASELSVTFEWGMELAMGIAPGMEVRIAGGLEIGRVMGLGWAVYFDRVMEIAMAMRTERVQLLEGVCQGRQECLTGC